MTLMRAYTLTHLSNADLLNSLASLVARDRSTTLELLAHIAEVDARRLYVPAGYSSMHSYCVGEFGLSDDAVYKRIHAARAARDFPALFTAFADGRLHLTAIRLLAPHVNAENVERLIAAATHQRSAAIERILAGHDPKPDVATSVRALPVRSPVGHDQLAPGQVAAAALGQVADQDGAPVVEDPELKQAVAPPDETATTPLASGQAINPVDAPVERRGTRHNAPPVRPAPLSAGRYALRFTIGQDTHDRLKYAQELLSHAVPSGDVPEVFDRALRALIRQLEKRKFAACDKPSTRSSGAAGKRRVPAHVRRAVWRRDCGQCTFVSHTGHRCEARKFLEYDHIDPVARGGLATLDNLRLRCRVHNQYEAEIALGAEFMSRKRDEASCERAATRCA